MSLRVEATNSIKNDDDWNNGVTFKNLRLCDSAIRESLLCHSILTKGLTKEVVHSEGLELPDNTHIHRGGLDWDIGARCPHGQSILSESTKL